MSLSRQVLSSPFDAPQRPRTAASRQNGDRKRVKEGGSSLATNNIMVDTRIVRRSVLFDGSMAKGFENCNDDTDRKSGCILFDSRLTKGDKFANPIVTVTDPRQGSKGNDQKTRKSGPLSTPPPVKGRNHVSVQTDDDTSFFDQSMLVTSAHELQAIDSSQTIEEKTNFVINEGQELHKDDPAIPDR